MKKTRLLVPVFLAVVLSALPLLPAGAGESAPESGNLKSRIQAWQKSQDYMGEALYSQVRFEEEAFEKVFGRSTFPMVGFGSGWYPVKNLCLGFYLGGMYETGSAVGAISGKGSGEDTAIYILPVRLNLAYRFSFVDEQIVVPSVWAGFDYWYFREVNEFADNVDGDKSGWHWGAELAFLLDSLDRGAAHFLKRDFGIDSTYLTAGYQGFSVGESEDGLRFSGDLYSVGLRFEVSGK